MALSLAVKGFPMFKLANILCMACILQTCQCQESKRPLTYYYKQFVFGNNLVLVQPRETQSPQSRTTVSTTEFEPTMRTRRTTAKPGEILETITADCPTPPEIKNGYIEDTTDYSYGTKRRIVCDEGARLNAPLRDIFATCTEYGIWSFTASCVTSTGASSLPTEGSGAGRNVNSNQSPTVYADPSSQSEKEKQAEQSAVIGLAVFVALLLAAIIVVLALYLNPIIRSSVDCCRA